VDREGGAKTPCPEVLAPVLRLPDEWQRVLSRNITAKLMRGYIDQLRRAQPESTPGLLFLTLAQDAKGGTLAAARG
jgi:hypothetical protein